MSKIILTDEQLNILHQSSAPLAVCDLHGKVLGTVNPELSHDFLQKLKQSASSAGPWYTGDNIQAMFRFLEAAWSKEGGFDEQRMQQLIEEFDAQGGQVS